MNKTGVFTVVLMLLASGVFAAEQAVVTEEQAVELAVKNNSETASYKSMYKAAQAESHARWWLKNPMLELEYMDIDSGTLSLAGAGAKNISISQEIPMPFKMPFRIGAANESASAAKWRYELMRRQTALKAYNAYASLYRTVKEIEITKESAAALKQVSRIAASRYGRTMAGGDMGKADLEYALLENRVEELLQEKEVKIAQLTSLSNGTFAPGENSEFKPPEIIEMTGSLEELTQAAIDNSPEVRMAEAELRMKENMKNASYLEYIPDINVKFTKQIEPAMDNYSLMFGVEVPLWFPATQQSVIGAAGDEYEAALKQFEDMKNKAVYEAKEMFESIKTHGRTMKLYSDILIPKAEASFKALAESYRSGKAGFLDVLEAERMMLELKTDYYMHMEEYVMHYRTLMACCAVVFVAE